MEILAASWKEKRAEIARLQRSRRFSQANIVKKKFVSEVGDVRKQTRCFRCQKVGHWARNCPNKASAKGDDRSSSAAGAAVVWEAVEASEAMLVSSPGFGIIDSGCGRTLIGQATLGAFYRLLSEAGQSSPTLRRREQSVPLWECARGDVRKGGVLAHRHPWTSGSDRSGGDSRATPPCC